MFHGITNQFLYTAFQLTPHFVDSTGAQKTGKGTGFFIQNKRREICLVTNRHLLDLNFNEQTGKYKDFSLRLVQVRGWNDNGNGGLSLLMPQLNNIQFPQNSENDVAVVINPLLEFVTPIRPLDHFFSYDIIAKQTDFDEKLHVCDFVAFPGYPEWHDKLEGRPILRTGTISSDPRKNYSWRPTSKGDCVAYEAFSYGGSSGSPVIAVQKGPKPGEGISFPGFRDLMLIGINAGHLPHPDLVHSGISYFYKSTVILDLADA